jgi:phage shock protein PspC (stress-responsive transcriptional regulator)
MLVALDFITGIAPMFFFYIIAWIVVPEAPAAPRD